MTKPANPTRLPAQAAPERASRGFAKTFLITAALIATLDLSSKAWAWAYVAEHGGGGLYPEVRVFGTWFRLVRAENTGTIWGLFQDSTAPLIVVRVVMVLALASFAFVTPARERAKQLGFGLVLGGALGNLYDNLFRDNHAVRDFLDFWIPLPWLDRPYHYPTFNIADSAILCGAVTLFFAFAGDGRREKAAAARASSEDGERPSEER